MVLFMNIMGSIAICSYPNDAPSDVYNTVCATKKILGSSALLLCKKNGVYDLKAQKPSRFTMVSKGGLFFVRPGVFSRVFSHLGVVVDA